MKKKSSKAKAIGGALAVGALGVVAGMLLAPKSGKKLQNDIKKASAGFLSFIAPKLKKLKGMSDKEYKSFVKTALAAYSKVKKLSAKEAKELSRYADSYWKKIKGSL